MPAKARQTRYSKNLMGQDITVTKAPSADENTIIFSLNRSLTGMEILNFSDVKAPGSSDDAAYVAAMRILEKGATNVSVYSNVVSVTADKSDLASIETESQKILENLFRFYGDEAGWAPGEH
jgi:hypothetical protein